MHARLRSCAVAQLPFRLRGRRLAQQCSQNCTRSATMMNRIIVDCRVPSPNIVQYSNEQMITCPDERAIAGLCNSAIN